MDQAQAFEQARLACDEFVSRLNQVEQDDPSDEERVWTTVEMDQTFTPALNGDPTFEDTFTPIADDGAGVRWIVHASFLENVGFVIVEPGLRFNFDR